MIAGNYIFQNSPGTMLKTSFPSLCKVYISDWLKVKFQKTSLRKQEFPEGLYTSTKKEFKKLSDAKFADSTENSVKLLL